MDEEASVCPACKAPQIRVAASQPEEIEFHSDQIPNDSSGTPAPGSPGAIANPAIAWADFFRIASPLSALTGILAVAIPVLGLFLMLPFSVRWVIFRYRSQHPVPMNRIQGARMGAFAGMLSFLSFLIFSLATVSLKHEAAIKMVQDSMKNNPDPRTQQLLQILSTHDGFIAFLILSMLIAVVLFLLLGMGSGALAVPAWDRRKRP